MPTPKQLHPGYTFDEPDEWRQWSFSNGPEWPGAAGRLEYRPEGGLYGSGALALLYDFTGGGHYVAAMVELPTDQEIRAVALNVLKDSDNLMIFRAEDAQGEVFQKALQFACPGWQAIVVTLDDWEHHWGGDGVFQWPARRFDVLVENQGASRKGEILIDDVRWRATVDHARKLRTRFVDSHFRSDDRWWTRDGTYDAGRWDYRFDRRGLARLELDRSIPGHPRRLWLTVDSDGSGHELLVQCGSHFQTFEKSLGVLSRTGAVRFSVPMGQMRDWKHTGGENDGVVRYPLRLLRLVLARRGDAQAGSLRLLALQYETEIEPSEVLPVSLSAQPAGDDSVRFAAVWRNLLDVRISGRAAYEIRTPDGWLRDQRVSRTADPRGGSAMLECSARFGGHDLLAARFCFIPHDRHISPVGWHWITLARPQTPGDEDLRLEPSSRIGVGLYLYRLRRDPRRRDLLERMCRLAAAAGVKWSREEFHWNWIEPQQGRFDFEFYDELVDVATRHGISIYGLAAYWTDWTGPPRDEAFIAPYCRFLREVATRYRGRIRHWEIWNEPNIFFWPASRALYARLLSAAYATLKSVDPQIEVLGCSTAGVDQGFIREVIAAGGRFDALTVHPYRGSLDPDAYLRELQSVCDLAGRRDIWITEIGWPSHIGGCDELTQAGLVARTYITSLAMPHVRSVSWYDFREDGCDPYYNEHHFGLVRRDLQPKAGYLALATVGRLLGGARFERRLPRVDDDDLWAFAFASHERRIVALWSPGRPRVVALKVTADGPVHVLGTTGERIRGAAGDDGLMFGLPRDMPVYVVGPPGMRLTYSSDPIRVVCEPAVIRPGEKTRLRVIAGDRPVRLRMDGSLPPGLSLGHSGYTLTCSESASPGRYEVLLELDVGGGAPVRLPVEIRVVPRVLYR